VRIQSDKLAIRRIINNLFDNAVKYTKVKRSQDKSIKISLKRTAFTRVVIRVEDNGIGIPEEKKEAIFQAHYKIDHPEGGSTGSGMGLHIVKKIVHELGGEIQLDSVPEIGSTFTVHLPSIQGEPVQSGVRISSSPEIKNRVTQPEKKGRGELVMLIEDQEAIQNLVGDELTRQGYRLLQAYNGLDAFDLLKESETPSLIITDIMMERLAGDDFVRILREQPQFREIPVIFLTAKGDRESQIAGMNLGAIDYVSKPFDLSLLLMKVNNVIRQYREIRENLVEEMRRSAIGSHLAMSEELTIREKCRRLGFNTSESEIIEALIDRVGHKELSDLKCISEAGIRKVIYQKIYRKLGINSVKELKEILIKSGQTV
jgi:DNA-binding response OmpR family regulator